MVLIQYLQQSVIEEHIVHLELAFVMHVHLEPILTQGHHFVLLVLRDTHVMIPARLQ